LKLFGAIVWRREHDRRLAVARLTIWAVQVQWVSLSERRKSAGGRLVRFARRTIPGQMFNTRSDGTGYAWTTTLGQWIGDGFGIADATLAVSERNVVKCRTP
jgi:hypothetical protein